MNLTTKMVSDFLNEQHLNHIILRDDLLALVLEFYGVELLISLCFDESRSLPQVHLQGEYFISVPTEKYDVIYKALNKYNFRYNYSKFILDTENPENGSILIRVDTFIHPETCGSECLKLMYSMVATAEETYSKFMKVLQG